MTVRIMVGDCRKVLRGLPSESVQCVVTSPPFWGLRNYSTEPLVWGGDADCDHEWEDATYIRNTDQGVGPKQRSNVGSVGRDVPAVNAFCLKCGAWRGSLGLEPNPELFVAHLVEVFREVKRVLRDDGTLWLNLGDSYASGKGSCFNPGGGENSLGKIRKAAGVHPLHRGNVSDLHKSGLKPKDLVPISWMVAMALQRDGWWLRSAITWCKTNPMPESMTDRPTKATEMIFLLSKQKHYFYDKNACLAPLVASSLPRAKRGVSASNKWLDGAPGSTAHTMSRPRPNVKLRGTGHGGDGAGFRGHSGYYDAEGRLLVNPAGRNLWNYWIFPTANFPGSHFAVFPEEIPRRAILLGTSEKGQCPKCDQAWVRVVERGYAGASEKRGGHRVGGGGSQGNIYNIPHEYATQEFKGWQPACACYDHLYRTEFPKARSARKRCQRDVTEQWFKRVRKRPGLAHWETERQTVCDPFSGAGTTGLVAEKLGRNAVLIELNPDYAQMAQKRILDALGPMFTNVAIEDV